MLGISSRQQWEQHIRATKVSDFIQIVRILKVLFDAYFRHVRMFWTVSLYVKYCTRGFFASTAQDFARIGVPKDEWHDLVTASREAWHTTHCDALQVEEALEDVVTAKRL